MADTSSSNWFSQLFTGVTDVASSYLDAKAAKEQSKTTATTAKATADAIKSGGTTTGGVSLSTGGIVALAFAGVALLGGFLLIAFRRN